MLNSCATVIARRLARESLDNNAIAKALREDLPPGRMVDTIADIMERADINALDNYLRTGKGDHKPLGDLQSMRQDMAIAGAMGMYGKTLHAGAKALFGVMSPAMRMMLSPSPVAQKFFHDLYDSGVRLAKGMSEAPVGTKIQGDMRAIEGKTFALVNPIYEEWLAKNPGGGGYNDFSRQIGAVLHGGNTTDTLIQSAANHIASGAKQVERRLQSTYGADGKPLMDPSIRLDDPARNIMPGRFDSNALAKQKNEFKAMNGEAMLKRIEEIFTERSDTHTRRMSDYVDELETLNADRREIPNRISQDMKKLDALQADPATKSIIQTKDAIESYEKIVAQLRREHEMAAMPDRPDIAQQMQDIQELIQTSESSIPGGRKTMEARADEVSRLQRRVENARQELARRDTIYELEQMAHAAVASPEEAAILRLEYQRRLGEVEHTLGPKTLEKLREREAILQRIADGDEAAALDLIAHSKDRAGFMAAQASGEKARLQRATADLEGKDLTAHQREIQSEIVVTREKLIDRAVAIENKSASLRDKFAEAAKLTGKALEDHLAKLNAEAESLAAASQHLMEDYAKISAKYEAGGIKSIDEMASHASSRHLLNVNSIASTLPVTGGNLAPAIARAKSMSNAATAMRREMRNVLMDDTRIRDTRIMQDGKPQTTSAEGAKTTIKQAKELAENARQERINAIKREQAAEAAEFHDDYAIHAKDGFASYVKSALDDLHDQAAGLQNHGINIKSTLATPIKHGPLKDSKAHTYLDMAAMREAGMFRDDWQMDLSHKLRADLNDLHMTQQTGSRDGHLVLEQMYRDYARIADEISKADTFEDALKIAYPDQGATEALWTRAKEAGLGLIRKDGDWRGNLLAAMQKRMQHDRDTMKYLIDRNRGINPNAAGEIAQGVLTLSYASKASGMGVSNIPDIIRNAHYLGLKNTIGALAEMAKKAAMEPGSPAYAIWKARMDPTIRSTMHQFGFAQEGRMNSQLMRDLDGNNTLSTANHNIEKVGEFATDIGGLNYLQASNELAVIAEKNVALTKAILNGDVEVLKSFGLGKYDHAQIKAELMQHGQNLGEKYSFDLGMDKWRNQEAASAIRAAIRREVENIVSRPGVLDKPMVLQTPVGQFVSQFAGFMFSTITRATLRDPQIFGSSNLAMGHLKIAMTHMMVQIGKELISTQGDYLSSSPSWYVYKALDGNPALSLVMYLTDRFGKITGFNPIEKAVDAPFSALGFDSNQNIHGDKIKQAPLDPVTAVMGAPAGMAKSFITGAGRVASGLVDSDKSVSYNAAKQMMAPLPGNNHPVWQIIRGMLVKPLFEGS